MVSFKALWSRLQAWRQWFCYPTFYKQLPCPLTGATIALGDRCYFTDAGRQLACAHDHTFHYRDFDGAFHVVELFATPDLGNTPNGVVGLSRRQWQFGIDPRDPDENFDIGYQTVRISFWLAGWPTYLQKV